MNSLEKFANNVDVVKKREDIKLSERISAEGAQIESGASNQGQDIMGNIDTLSKSIKENTRKLNEARKNLGLLMTDEDPPSILTDKERLKKLQSEAVVGQPESDSERPETTIKRYLGGGTEGIGLDPRIVDYFRNYVGLEETLRRFNNMDQDNQRYIASKIKAGEIEEVVTLMENYTLNQSDQISQLADAFGGLPQDRSKWEDWGRRTMSAEKSFNNRGSTIKSIIKRLNQNHGK